MSLKRINANLLLKFSVEDLWEILTGKFILVFPDDRDANGKPRELETNWRETLYSSYGWEFHRDYPGTPLLLKHHVKWILGNKRLGSDTHLELLGNCMWSVYDHYRNNRYRQDLPDFRDELAEKVYRLTNRMYNSLSYRLEEYVTSLDIIDFISASEQPEIKAALDNAQPTNESIEEVYETIKSILKNPATMPNNPISLAAQSDIVSMGQVVQCIGPRGFLTDTDSNIFRYPVMRGYHKGMRTLYNSLVESRSAAKSLLFSKTPLQQAEYFSRRLQLMSQIVRNLHDGDCGTPRFMIWQVRGEERGHDGKLERPSDLKYLAGKHYIDDNGMLKTIGKNKEEDKKLIGKAIKLRSVLYCAHEDEYGVCATCFGELALSVPKSTNLGHMCCTSMTQKSSQMVLSVKHLDGSSAVDSIAIASEDRNYLKAGSDDTSYLLHDRLKNKKVWLVIPHERAGNLADIEQVGNVEDLHVSRVTELEEVGFIVNDGKIEERARCFVHMGRRLSSMTYPLLRHIRKQVAQHGWVTDENHNYVFDMTGWDYSQPILELPLKHINMSDHSRDIAQMLESRVEDMHHRATAVSPDAFLVELFNLVNDKLTVNLAVLEVILYGAMIRSAENFDYSLPKPWTTRGLGVMKNSMALRSLAAAMAFEGHHDIITSPLSYTLPNRPDHPMDGILMPAEVFEGRYSR